jgi:hypothetical protein
MRCPAEAARHGRVGTFESPCLRSHDPTATRQVTYWHRKDSGGSASCPVERWTTHLTSTGATRRPGLCPYHDAWIGGAGWKRGITAVLKSREAPTLMLELGVMLSKRPHCPKTCRHESPEPPSRLRSPPRHSGVASCRPPRGTYGPGLRNLGDRRVARRGHLPICRRGRH